MQLAWKRLGDDPLKLIRKPPFMARRSLDDSERPCSHGRLNRPPLRPSPTLTRRLAIGACAALSLAWLTIAPRPAHAQYEETDPTKLEAMEHFNRAVELYREGSLEAALVEFERTYELYPSYKLLYNLAQLHSDRHDYVAALQLYRRYLAEGQDAIDEERHQHVTEEISRLSLRVGSLWVASEQDGAELFIDGTSVGSLPLSEPLLVNSGVRDIRLVKEGFLTAEESLRVAGGDQLRVNLPLVEKPDVVALPVVEAAQPVPEATPAPTTLSAESEDRENHTPFFISIALAGALTAGAATLGVMTALSDRRLDDALGQYPADLDAVDNARSRTRTYATVTDGLAIGAAVMAGVAFYFLLDPPSEERETQAWLTPGGLEGRF